MTTWRTAERISWVCAAVLMILVAGCDSNIRSDTNKPASVARQGQTQRSSAAMDSGRNQIAQGERQSKPDTTVADAGSEPAEVVAVAGIDGQPEDVAWEAAVKLSTPSAYAAFFRNYPKSPHITTRTGILRGRYWFKLDDADNQNGVIVTVEGMNVLVNVSLEEAKRLGVINSKPSKRGLKVKAKFMTFHYVYVEITEGAHIVGKMVNNKPVKEVIEPKDNADSTLVLSADGTRLLAWDLSKAKPSTPLASKPTFVVAAAAARQAFNNDVPNDGPWKLDKQLTPESQPGELSGEDTGL